MEKQKSKQSKTITILFIISAIIGLPSAIITIYLFLEKHNIEMTYEVVSENNVLDIKEDVEKLEIFYNGENIKKKKENLKLLNIKVINNGNKILNKWDYVQDVDLGLCISNGRVIDQPKIIYTSNNYLKEKTKIKTDLNKNIYLPFVTMEGGEFYKFKVLIIQSINRKLIIKPLGKISGQIEIPVINTVEDKRKKEVLVKLWTFQDPFYLISFLGLFVSILLFIMTFLLVKVRKKREFELDSFAQRLKLELAVRGVYSRLSISNLNTINDDEFNEIVDSIRDISKQVKQNVSLLEYYCIKLNENYSLESMTNKYHFIRYRLDENKKIGVLTTTNTDNEKISATFKVVQGLYQPYHGNMRFISFESVEYPNHYLRHKNYEIELVQTDNSDLFKNDSTFFLVEGLAQSSCISFQSINYPEYYIIHEGFKLYIKKESEIKNNFKELATFHIVSPLYNKSIK